MSNPQKRISILTFIFIASLLTIGCAKTQEGQLKIIERKPDPPPPWTLNPGEESDPKFLAFKGRSGNTAQPVDAERQAYQNALEMVSNYLFSHVNTRIQEVIEGSNRRSGIYDPTLTEKTVKDIVSDVFASGTYPSEIYLEHFKRYERQRWVYYYQAQMLVKFPHDQVDSARQMATRRRLEQLTATLTKAAAQETDPKKRAEIEREKDLALMEIEALSRSEPPTQPEQTTSTPSGNIWALVVGIDRYEHDVTPLRFAARDAQLFAGALKSVTSKEQVWLMTHDMEHDDKPTHTNVLFRLERLSELVKPTDTLLFFFSGHSITKDAQHYLLSINADTRTLTTLENSSISLDSLRDALRRCKAKQVVLFLDGCRNFPEAGKGDADNLLTDSFAASAKRLKIEPYTPETPTQNYAILFACSVGERAYEWAQYNQGVFSHFLIRGFLGAAADAEGRVTVTSLGQYLQQQVGAWSQKNRPAGRGQTPWFHLEGRLPMVLRP